MSNTTLILSKWQSKLADTSSQISFISLEGSSNEKTLILCEYHIIDTNNVTKN